MGKTKKTAELIGFIMFGVLWLAVAVDVAAGLILPDYHMQLARVIYDYGSPLQLGTIAYIGIAFVFTNIIGD